MKKLAILAVVAILICLPTLSQADIISGIVAADNHFTLYVGDANGDNLINYGRNTYGEIESQSGLFNWKVPVNFSGVAVLPGQYLYVAAWDCGGSQMWVGDFTNQSGGKLYSNTNNWQFIIGSGSNPGDLGSLNDTTVQNDISHGGWAAPLAEMAVNDGSAVWNTGGFPASQFDFRDQFVWHDTLGDSSGSDNNYAIFRSNGPFSPVPLPSTLLLLGSGMVGLLALRRGIKGP